MVTTIISPYLDGNFAPVQEEITADELVVIGELPPDLSGMFVRNGPNPKFAPIGRHQWFDGDGMLHGVQINHGKASYRNRYVQTRALKMEIEAGRSLWKGPTEPPNFELPHNNLFGPFKNTANTAVVWHGGKLLALWEGAEPYEIAVPNLETVGPYNYQGKLASRFTAHPKVDPETGEMMFYGYAVTSQPYLQYNVVSREGELTKTVTIDIPAPVMMHDFAITEHYTIFMYLPLTFSMERIMRGESAYLFESDVPSCFGILPRYGDNSNIQWFEAPSCYIFHTVNAYEAGEEIVLIACRMSGTTSLDIPTKFSDGQDDKPRLYRWRFNLRTGAVYEEPLDDLASDFPSLNQQRLGRQSRYAYTAKMASGQRIAFSFDGLLKYDLTTNSSQVYELGLGRYGGEAVFVPRPNTNTEDDGWLMTFVYDSTQQASELLVLNAQDLTTEPVARVLIPQRVPYGFHGIWIPQELGI
ncbi:9-cis-epoxycarotenoid dioxygenase [Fischerella thermalis CCMEE 5273]|jgi:carotenoid cleavage dioxygenase-like enzyme|uniref:9-cis-epoxycarotenoid dioxygenase n=1 Tax=Fischerella thermalis CCMEE 5268 TaxID=2019662 RepID=A0A2N6KLQ8_9CYAN|nr:carotenoid oxygenase family protein [Fischerella thermalis]PMB00797.1 9-cis-epoxycarotenoid dioxygenase [Fischerella thermalis CCMEE 5268]PMB05356.1 9-cis-epoxycarotenoid dioxygenase [Fischerella thermalis CCMEE 5273]